MTLFSPRRLLAAALLLTAAPLSAVTTEIISVTDRAAELDANGNSTTALDVSQDGRYALFSSDASNLVPGDTNRRPDLFLYDAQTDTVERVSLGANGSQLSDAFLVGGAFSADARLVMFSTNADGVVNGIDGAGWQIYERDRVAGTTILVSRTAGGQPLAGAVTFNGMSADGRYVLLATPLALDAADANDRYDLYRLDRQTGTYLLVTQAAGGGAANRDTTNGQISADGGTVAFIATSTNVVANDTNNSPDLFVRELASATTLLASRTTAGQFPPSLSFSQLPRGRALSADGRYFVFSTNAGLDPLDTNDYRDGYLFDRTTQSVRRMTLTSDGAQIAFADAEIGSIAADASHLAFTTQGGVLPGQTYSFARSYRLPLASNAPQQIEVRPFSWGDDVSDCQLSGDAASAYCSFVSDSMGGSDQNSFVNLYRAVLQPAAVRRVSRPQTAAVAAANHDSGDFSGPGSANADARYVVFNSLASNLVVGDFNGRRDLFLRDRLLGTTTRLNLLPDGSEATCNVGDSRVSADGRYIAFESCDDLVPGIGWGYQHVFHLDRVAGEIRLVSRNVQGQPGNSRTTLVDMSDDGNVVALYSQASNLVPLTPNPDGDYFLKDLSTGVVTLASRRPGGAVDSYPTGAHLSGDGRYLLFGHTATDLVDGDTNGVSDAFVFDRSSQQIERVSLDATGSPLTARSVPLGISRDGRDVLFYTDGAPDGGSPYGLYVRDRVDGGVERVSRNSAGESLNYPGTSAALSPDGNLVVLRCICDNSGYFDPNGSFVELLHVYDRRSAHLGLAAPSDLTRYIEAQRFAGNDALLFTTRANDLVANDANNHFRDVFLARAVGDVMFADGFATAD